MNISKNKEILDSIIKRDNAKLIGDYDKINQYNKIIFRCNCANQHSKILKVIISRGGAFCINCSRENKIKKIKKVLSNSELINNKKKETCNKKYGTDYAIQSKEVQQKIQKKFNKI